MTPFPFQSRDEVIRRCVRIQRFFVGKYEAPDAMVRIEPVAIPWGDELYGNNGHLGWPVAALADGTLIVVYHRNPQHTPRWGVEKPKDRYHCTAVVTRSTDYGRTWTRGVDIREFVETPTENCLLRFGNSICTTKNGLVVLVTAYGVFRSGDRGQTWEHLPESYSAGKAPGAKGNNGPRIVEHPELGLLTFTHTMDRFRLIIRGSKDDGLSWQQTDCRIGEWAASIEPAGLYHDGGLFVLARAHGKESYEPDRKTWRYIQHSSPEGGFDLQAAFTNIRTTDITDEIPIDGYGPFSQDTPDLDYNPVSRHIEAVCTNRCGGGEGKEQRRMQMTLNLWSIDPDELRAGLSEWRFEGTLLTHAGTMATGSDGMHPGGAVIDLENHVQRIYVYLGLHLGPAGVFSITRSLDTPELSRWLKKESN